MPAMKYAGMLTMLETQPSRLGIFPGKRRKLNTNDTLKEYGNIYFLINLLLRTVKITLKSVFKFLVACLISEILKDKDMTKRLVIRHLEY